MNHLIIIFFVFIVIIFVLILYWSLRNGISPMPTSPKVKHLLINSLPKKWHGAIYELGSGWGTLAFPLAAKYPNCSVLAYENSPVPYLYSKILYLFFRHKNLLLKRQDFFEVDLKNAKMIVCYLYPGAMLRLKTKFEQELPQDSLVISHTFSVPGWKADKIIEVPDLYHSKIYIYHR